MIFQWDAVDASPDLGGQNVLKTFEMAIPRKRRTTRVTNGIRESFLSLDLFFRVCSKIFFWYSRGWGRSPPSPLPPYGSATDHWPGIGDDARQLVVGFSLASSPT